MSAVEVECPLPPNVVNTTWHEDKKSLRQRRVIYQCLPRYRHLSGQLWKACGPRGDWVGDDAICEGGPKTPVVDIMSNTDNFRFLIRTLREQLLKHTYGLYFEF